MRYPIYQVDAFTDRPFAGNPAGVMPLAEWLPTETMQKIAAEMNVAETAFFVPETVAGEAGYHIRWFTPEVEMPLCGHATLASGFILTRYLKPELQRIVFQSRSGPLYVSRRGEMLELDFPAGPSREVDDPALAEKIRAAVGFAPRALLTGWVHIALLESAAAVAAVVPDYQAMKALDKDVVVTAPGEDGIDFVSRFFAPRLGIPEDPVTGATHCIITPYWARRLGRSEMRARQLSPRGGDLWVVSEGERVRMAGHSVCVLRGELEL